MFIIPFIHKRVEMNNMCINVFRVLTIGGISLWKENDSFTIDSVLKPNDIFLCSTPYHINDTYFCKVDTTKTNMNDFYKWEEVEDNDTFCWRTFYVFGEKDAYMSWLPIPNEKIGHYTYQELFDCMYELCKV
jgi:hypothetical protein